MRKSIFFLLLTVLLSMAGAKAFAHDIEVANADGVTIYYVWTNNNTELEVSYRGNYPSSYSQYKYKGNIVIPASVTYKSKVYNVTSISGSAFCDCSELTSVTIPNSVTSIGGEAFRDCHALTSITAGLTKTVQTWPRGWFHIP